MPIVRAVVFNFNWNFTEQIDENLFRWLNRYVNSALTTAVIPFEGGLDDDRIIKKTNKNQLFFVVAVFAGRSVEKAVNHWDSSYRRHNAHNFAY